MAQRGVFLRTARDQDSPAVASLVFDVLQEYKLTAEPDGVDADLRDLHNVYQAPGGIFEVLVTEEGEIVGCYGLVNMGEGVCELRKMYLRPDRRGQGLGKALLSRALSVAKSKRFVEMQLETASCLVEAIQLYRDFGFKPLPGKHEVERCDLAFHYNLSEWDETSIVVKDIPFQ